MTKHIHIHLGRPAKARDAKQHYNEGSMAATKGVKYDANPYVRGSQEHLDWSKGHNDLRAKRAKDAENVRTGKLNKRVKKQTGLDYWEIGEPVKATFKGSGLYRVEFKGGEAQTLGGSSIAFNDSKSKDVEFKRGDRVKITNPNRYDSFLKPTPLSGTVESVLSDGRVAVIYRSPGNSSTGQMNVKASDLTKDAKDSKSKDARGVTPESLAKAKEKASRILQILSSSSAASNLIQGDLDEAQRGLNNALNWLN